MSKKEKKSFAKEFKEFIARGSIVDMAVGVVVGGAFTTIVNTLVSAVLTPLINFVIFKLCGGNTDVFTGLDITLIPATTNEEGVIVTEATVLRFSSLITAIINFILIALTLFCIIRVINHVREEADAMKAEKEAERKAKEEAEAKAKDVEVTE